MPVSITSRFRPMTYDEISRPLIEQTQAQQALEGAYMEASTQAAQIMAQADQQTDPIAYERLKSYSEALQQQADSLMQQGLNRSSRRALLEMRNRYNQYIMPVQNAIERRNKLMEERHQLRLTHPDMLQERDVLKLDDLLQNPQMDFGKTLYGSDITKRAAALTQAIGRGRQSIDLGPNLDKYTQTILSQSGLTAQEIQAALNGNAAEADKVLEKALAGLYSSTGVDSWDNQAAKDAVRGYIREGAMQGVGDLNISAHQDQDALRRDRAAERAEDRAFQAALYGKKWDKEEGRWVDDPDNVNGKGRRPKLKEDGTIDGTNDNNVVLGPKSAKYGGNICRTEDGTYCVKTGKDQYVPIAPELQQDAAAEFDKGTTQKEAKLSMLQSYPMYIVGESNPKLKTYNERPDWEDWDEEEVEIDKLPESVKKTVKGYVETNGLDLDDITVYEDQQWVGPNRFKITYDPVKAKERREQKQQQPSAPEQLSEDYFKK